MAGVATKQDALRLYRDILRAARSFTWPHESGRPWRDVLVESARAEFEQSKHVTDPTEIMRRLVVGRHCLEKTAKKFEETRQDILRSLENAPPPLS
mmetsp:Transcript_23230/g.68466  ORF Transcript_23230/g.68466 Transcript_23230/m.68466 type:complete len:96 (+) Transcript_23230:20-307(+)